MPRKGYNYQWIFLVSEDNSLSAVKSYFSVPKYKNKIPQIPQSPFHEGGLGDLEPIVESSRGRLAAE